MARVKAHLTLLVLAALCVSVLGQRSGGGATTCSDDDDCRGKQVCCAGACSRTECADDGDDDVTAGGDNDDDDNDTDDGADFACLAVDASDEKRCARKTTQDQCERMQGRCEWTQLTAPTIPPNGECAAFEQCTQRDIAGDAISCSAVGACRDSQIDTVELTDCTAESSCAGSDIASGLVFCEGLGSCGATIHSTKTVECTGESACAATTDLTAERVSCGGSHSCDSAASAFSINNELSCSGEASCGGKRQVGHQATCSGNYGCVNMEFEPIDPADSVALLSCQASRSCWSSSFSFIEEVELFGKESGASSSFLGVNTIFALGYRSLVDAIVDSQSSTFLDIHVFGHESGSGADVFCRAGSECLVDCKGTACLDLELWCEPGASCSVEPAGCLDAMTGARDVDGVACPDIHENCVDGCEEEALLQHFANLHLSDDARGDGNGGRGGRNAVTDPPATERACDALEECRDETIDGDVKCNGQASCAGATIDATSIACGGAGACVGAQLTRGQSLGCNGFESCRDATVDTPAAELDCAGEASCTNVTVLGAAGVSCDGAESCRSLSMPGDTDYLRCNGRESCGESQVSIAGTLLCEGSEACMKAQMYSEADILCDGGGACIEAGLESATQIEVNGDHGLWSGTASASEVVLAASSALWYGAVDSEALELITVRAYGHMAGNYGAFICRAGSRCELECRGYGCYGLRFICMEGADCAVTPAACVPGTDNQELGGVVCPQWRDEELRLRQKVKQRQLFGVRAGEPQQSVSAAQVQLLAMVVGVALMSAALLAVCFWSKSWSQHAYLRL